MNEYYISNIQSIVAYAHIWGFILIFIFMAVESSFIPFPSEVVMIPAGFLATRGALTFQDPFLDASLAVIIGTAGSLAGSFFNYYFALLLGRPVLHKYGKYFFISSGILDRSESIFRSYGEITTFVCRLLPGIRQLISLPAGLSRMSVWRFALFTFLGAGLWVTILTSIGFYIGRISENMTYSQIISRGEEIITHNFIWLILALIAIIASYIYVHKKIMRTGAKKEVKADNE